MPAPIAMLRTKSLPGCAIGSAIECDTCFGIGPFQAATRPSEPLSLPNMRQTRPADFGRFTML